MRLYVFQDNIHNSIHKIIYTSVISRNNAYTLFNVYLSLTHV